MDIKGNFDVDYYLARLYRDPYDKERGVQPFRMRCFHEFYKRFSSSWDVSSVRLLEFGGGPVLYSLISACPHVSEIFFSDFQQASLDAIQGWKDGSANSHDWTPYFKYVISELEEIDSDDAVSKREEELRQKMSQLLICDILARDGILQSQDSALPETFDIVSCNLCLEVPAKSVDDYKRNVKTMSQLVKSGGFVLSIVVLESTFYACSASGERSFIISLKEADIRDAYEEAGFEIVTAELFDHDVNHNIIDGSKGNLFIVGQKRH